MTNFSRLYPIADAEAFTELACRGLDERVRLHIEEWRGQQWIIAGEAKQGFPSRSIPLLLWARLDSADPVVVEDAVLQIVELARHLARIVIYNRARELHLRSLMASIEYVKQLAERQTR